MTSMHKNIVPDQWLSDIIGKQAYTVVVDNSFVETTINDKSILRCIVNADNVFANTKVPVNLLTSISFLEEQGFHLVDSNVTFEKKNSSFPEMNGCCEVRFATPDDEVPTVELARMSFKCSRFHLDRSFSNEVANNIKAEWVRSFFLGKRGDMLIVALINNAVVGFLLLIKDDERTLIVDLIAVDSNFRGRGIAKDMIAFSQNQFKDLDYIRAGTQIANKPSINLYENLFFRFVEANYVFHYHSTSA
jgi:ribosomal protein S18 acetylase RimI-like enzyme